MSSTESRGSFEDNFPVRKSFACASELAIEYSLSTVGCNRQHGKNDIFCGSRISVSKFKARVCVTILGKDKTTRYRVVCDADISRDFMSWLGLWSVVTRRHVRTYLLMRQRKCT